MESPNASDIEIINENLVNAIAGFLQEIGARQQVVLTSISGIGASGKSTLAKRIADKLGQEATILETDDYLIPKQERRRMGITIGNPSSTKLDLLKRHLEELKQGRDIIQPVYYGETESKEFKPEKYVFLEGTWALAADYQHLFDLRIYVECDIEIQKSRRFERDTVVKGQTREEILSLLAPRQAEFDRYIAPNRTFADLVLVAQPDFTLEIAENRMCLEL